jgi:pSer/pThr/pTyr-binding forkhead associated (FHA) protein
MYKLVVIAGKHRGKEFLLEAKEAVIGRSGEADFQIDTEGISKNHFSISIADDTLYLKDLNSSNGTFLNGKGITSATLEHNDKIAVPDTILQVILVKEKKIYIKQKMKEDDNAGVGYLDESFTPTNLPSRILHIFKFKIMPVIHGINEEYEWRSLFAILLSIFVIATISLTILPVLRDSKKLLLLETAMRGRHYADEIARLNAKALERRNLEALNTEFLDSEPGVSSYELFDLEGRIVRPITKLNEYIEDTFSIQAHEYIKKKQRSSKTIGELPAITLKDGEIGIAKAIVAYNVKSGNFEPVGIIAIHFEPKSLAVEAAKNTKAYLESLTTSAIVAIIFFGIVYYLTIRPIDELRIQLERALRGDIKSIEPKLLMSELNVLRNSINSIILRNRELQHDTVSSDFGEQEDDAIYVDSLNEFMKGAGVPVIVLDSEKLIQKINTEAEDLTGIRESSSVGLELIEVCREKGLAVQLLELCNDSSSNSGTSQEGEYDLGGSAHNIFVTGLIGKDNFTKAFYITFIREE